MGKLLKLIDNGDGTFSVAASTERSVLPSGAATSAKQDAIIDYVDELESKIGEVAELPTTNTIMDRLKAIATNTANIKVDADTINVNTDELESLLTTLSAKDFATQATLAQIKSILDTDGIKKIIDPLPVGSNLIGKIDVNSSALPTGASTEAKQDNIISYVDEIESGLTTLNAKDFATQATLSGILTKLADPATQATLAQIKSILDTDGIKKIIDPLPVGSNLIGKIDVNSSALPTGAAQETTLEAVRAALVAGGLPSSTLETTHHDASTTNGNGAVANVSGYGPIAFQAVGTWDGATVTYKGSVDGTNYVALPGTSAVTADGIFQPVDPGVAGYKSVRAEITNAGATTSLTVKSLAVAIAKPTSADVIAIGKNAEGAAVTGNPLTIGYKNASGNATGVTPTNALPVQLSGSKAEIKAINLSDNSEVAPSTYAEVTPVIPVGKKWTILDWSLTVHPPTSATSGTHRVFAIVGGNPFYNFDIRMAYNKRFDYCYGQFVDGGNGVYLSGATIIPDDKLLWPNLLKGRIASSNLEIRFRYYNNTNAAQTIQRSIWLLVLEEAMTA
jgi:hypothetical protein